MKRVLITAGASGIGHATATAFGAQGYQVWVTDVDAAALADCPADWQRSRVDVADETAMAALFAEVDGLWGGLDVLCANAGTKGPTALVEDVALADWRACLAVNLDGAFLAARFALPMMKRAGAGVITFTSSTAGMYGYPNRSPYSAAKWAIIGLMKTVAMEAGPRGVRANAILPGSVEGPRMEAVLTAEAAAKGMTRDQVYQGYAKGTSLQTFVEARDVANLSVFLASDRARFISGQAIPVDGHTVNPDPQV
ncbi:MAG: SDR family oxidoreductase [Rhodobacteraceae bacterium]|nr:SDR family oxidoreductase [Paracoccaceae bacterium]